MIPFIKASAYGNDFLIVESTAYDGDKHALTRRLCDRTSGVGADGVEWIDAGDPGESDVSAMLINADGSEAEISGNGTRCVAAWMVHQQPAKRSVRIGTGAGVRRCEVVSVSGNSYGFASEMGSVLTIESRTLQLTGGAEIDGVFIDIGNPHFVITCNELPSDWRTVAKDVQGLDIEFPHGINVEFVCIRSRGKIEAYFYERGAGETLSSGTGSCASAVASRFRGLVDATVEVIAPGGVQTVLIDGDDITLRGTAHLICRGEAYL